LGRGSAVAETIDELARLSPPRPGTSTTALPATPYFARRAGEMWQKAAASCNSRPTLAGVLEWMVREGVEATVRAYGGELQHGFAASRDGPRTHHPMDERNAQTQ